VDEYQAAAQRIISVCGADRVRSALDWLKEQAAGRDDGAGMIERGEQDRLAGVLNVLSKMTDAIDEIAREDTAEADLDDAIPSAMLGRLVQALIRELDTT
jgi:hypothetical protein